MAVTIPDTIYDDTHTWQNANDRVAFQRAFAEGNGTERKIAQALLTANPLTANIEIQMNMNRPEPPPVFDSRDMTITDILAGDIAEDMVHVNDYHTTDFSGKQSSYQGTSMPAVVW